ncbi:MAG TPA: M50 family metallopeptidase [Bryobacteraceae bacterium]|nr:M50 family metallopeptidase [Bryobacteraceae bacterium]
MGDYRKRDTVVGWAFVAAGQFLILGHEWVTDGLMHARAYSVALFPDRLAAQFYFMGYFLLALLAAAGLLSITAWGVGHQRTWSRWTGLMPCLFLLAGFPYLTAVGGPGLYYLFTQRTVKPGALTGADFWNPRRLSGWMVAASVLGWFAAQLALSRLEAQAYRGGVPAGMMRHPGLAVFLLLLWVNVALHECGHALAAVAVGFRLKVLAVGPLVFTKNAGRLRVGFAWRGLLLSSGYMGAVPDSPRRFRLRQTMVVAAGPVASLLAGGIFLGIAFLLPGTRAQNLWGLMAMAAVIGFYVGTINLLPLGYCDGTMLFHLLLGTRRGEELTNLILRGAPLGAAGEAAREYQDDVEERRAKLRAMRESGDADPAQLGGQYISLGSVELAAEHRRDAEQHVQEGLALLAAAPSAAPEALGWWCLQALRTERHDRAGAAEAYQKGLAAAGRMAEGEDSKARLEALFSMAGLHVRAQAWERALETTTAALASCPEEEAWLVNRGMLLSYRAEALLQSGRVEPGLEAVGQAAANLRAQATGIAGPHWLGLLGASLWNAGRSKEAAALVTESIKLLEARKAMRLAAGFRLFLAEVLRSDGCAARAACVLPAEEPRDSDLRRIYHERRGAIRRSGGKVREAIADLAAVVTLVEEETAGDEIAGAAARGSLAAALAEAGDREQAAGLAREVYAKLEPTGHPEYAGACITLAVTGCGDWVDAALRGWNAAGCMLPAAKAREMEAAARALEAAGLAEAASQCRAAARQQWASLAVVRAQEALVG